MQKFTSYHYRLCVSTPKSSNSVFRLHTRHHQISLKEKNLYLLSELNDNLFSNNNKFSRIIKNNKLVQVINQPSGITSTSATLLGVTTNKPDIISLHNVVLQVTSDHDLISITVNVSKPKRRPITRTYRHHGNYCIYNFCLLLIESSQEINKMLTTNDINK